MKLILKFYEPRTGTITFGEHNLKDISHKSWRASSGVVMQEGYIFNDTIASNIGFGLNPEDVNPEIIKQAAQRAYVKHNIDDFPNSFETILGERGINLSGGQKQRVSIARAIAREPDILIFDDCLSAVDTETEEIILGNLRKIMEGKTTLLISHRVSTVKLADQIIVLDHGKVVEKGSHEELLAHDGEYRDLYQKQLLEEKKAVDS